MTTATRGRVIAAVALAVVALVQGLVLWRYAPPAALDAGAPPELFSAGRAANALDRVLGDGAPHPIGSEANLRVRERIVRELEALGLEVTLETGVACSRYGTCAEPVNVLASVPGKSPGPPILLVAHHDSVPAGPGAGDDGSGVATLIEVGRVLSREPPDKPVLLLFTDGEELGLLGAEAFVAKKDRPPPIAALNVEARGTSGPSLMFQTVGGSARFARLASSAVERPVTTSLAAAVYARMPNDTDLTVLGKHGIAGANFGFIGSAANYHTPRDALAQLDRGSLQHHGDTVLALSRALATETAPPNEDAVWFDVLAAGVLWWPMPASFPILFGALALFAAAGALGARGLSVRGRDVLAALATPLAIVAIGGALGLLFDLALGKLGATPAPFIAEPRPLLVAAWAIALGAVLLSSLLAGKAPNAEAHWATLWFWWSLLAGALTAKLPEASYLALVPVAVAALMAILHTLARQKLGAVVVFLPLVVVLILWLPIVHLLYDAIGFYSFAPYPLALAIALSPLAPTLSRLPVRDKVIAAGVALVVAVAALPITRLIPPFTEHVPQHVTFALHHDADTKTSRWMVDGGFARPPGAVLDALPFDPNPSAAHPWLGSLFDRVHVAPAQVAPLQPPVLEELWTQTSEQEKVIRARFRSARGSELLAIELPHTTDADILFNGVKASSRTSGTWRAYIWAGPARTGVNLEVRLRGATATDALLVDHGYGLPPEAKPLLEARPRSAVSIQLGDVTVVSRRVRL